MADWERRWKGRYDWEEKILSGDCLHMKKLDLVIVAVTIALGAGWMAARPSLPASSSLAARQFAGLNLGDSTAKVLGILGRPTRQEASNWFYKSPAGVLDLYWRSERLCGIQFSVDPGRLDTSHWSLAPELPMGCAPEQVRAKFGQPGRVRQGEQVETWNYPAESGQPASDLALGFEKGRLLHVRMSLL